jgi:hypothetical protein
MGTVLSQFQKNLLSAFDMQGFDMVVGVTQETINYQFKQLWKKGVIHKTLDFSAQAQSTTGHIKHSVSATLHANLDAPTVEILEGSDNRRRLLFHLKMSSGVLASPESFDQPLNFSNWEYVFTVNLDMQEIAQEAVMNHTAIPDEVKRSLNNFTDDMFTIRHLFMDFQDADLATYDKARSQCPMPDDWGGGDLAKRTDDFTLVLLQAALQGHFQSLAGTEHPYILGYAVESKQAGGVNLLPTLDPTSSTFSTNYNSANPALSSLNFLVMTNHHSLPTDPAAGLFTQSAVTSADADGRFLVAQNSFFSGWLLPQLQSAISLQQTPEYYHASNASGQGVKSSGSDTPNYGSVSALSATAWTINYDVYYYWMVSDGWDCWPTHVDAHYWQQDTRFLGLALTNPSPQTAQALLVGSFSVKYEVDYTCVWDNCLWTSANDSFTGDITFSGGTQGELGMVGTIPQPNPSFDSGSCAGSKLDALLDVNKNILNEQSTNFSNELPGLVTNLENSCNDARNRFVLPAGDVFFFKNPQFDQAGNLLLDITYKM